MPYRAVAAVTAVALALLYLSLEVRRLYHGPFLTFGDDQRRRAIHLLGGVARLRRGAAARRHRAALAAGAARLGGGDPAHHRQGVPGRHERGSPACSARCPSSGSAWCWSASAGSTSGCCSRSGRQARRRAHPRPTLRRRRSPSRRRADPKPLRGPLIAVRAGDGRCRGDPIHPRNAARYGTHLPGRHRAYQERRRGMNRASRCAGHVVSSRRGDDRRIAPGDHGAGRRPAPAVVRHYIERARAYNGVSNMLVTQDGAPVPEATGAVRAMAPIRFPTQTVKASAILPDLDKYKGPPLEYGRMEPTASDPAVQQQFGMIVGIPNAGQVNALGTLNIRGERSVTCRGDFDRHPSARAAAARRAAGVRILPPAARRAGARGRARRRLRAQSRSRNDADVRRRVLVQGSVRHQGHAIDRRRRCAPTTSIFPARDHVLVEQLAQQGRDHFRQGGQHRIQRARRRSRRPPHARQGAAVGARLSAQHLGRQSVQPLRHDARGLARLEFGIGAVGQHQSGDGEPRRGNARVLPRPVQPQCRRAHPAAQGDARLRRRRDRRGHLLRPQRHPRAHDRRLRQDSRCAEGPGRRAITIRAIPSRPCRARRC